MIPDFFQQVVNAAMYVLVLPVAFREWRRTERIDPALLFGLLLLVASFGTHEVHSSYVSVGTVLFLPSLVTVDRKRIPKALWQLLALFIAANIFWWGSGLTGSGVISGERSGWRAFM